ncbi:MAG: thioredoxin family protein [Melioribacteraceae bacterium]|jgi:peroxiredoxin|nr:thioredoxin family protein [Melioribacteraceae bacterium]
MATEKLKLGSSMPIFELLSVNGKKVNVKEAEGTKLMLVIFSCNHCPYVQAYEERIKKITSDYKDNLVVIAINSNDENNYPEDSFTNMKLRAEEKGFNFHYLRDETQEVAKLFGATHTPEVFLFNEKRELVFHGKIDDNWQDESRVNSNYLRNAINELLSGKEISIPETFTIGCTIKWK